MGGGGRSFFNRLIHGLVAGGGVLDPFGILEGKGGVFSI